MLRAQTRHTSFLAEVTPPPLPQLLPCPLITFPNAQLQMSFHPGGSETLLPQSQNGYTMSFVPLPWSLHGFSTHYCLRGPALKNSLGIMRFQNVPWLLGLMHGPLICCCNPDNSQWLRRDTYLESEVAKVKSIELASNKFLHISPWQRLKNRREHRNEASPGKMTDCANLGWEISL
jgi:hypothetical protein